jgi:hypothetical protein
MSRVQTWKNNINQSSHERFYLAKLNQNAGSTEFSQFDAWLVLEFSANDWHDVEEYRS